MEKRFTTLSKLMQVENGLWELSYSPPGMLSISMCSGGRRISPSLNVYYTIYCCTVYLYIYIYAVCACSIIILDIPGLYMFYCLDSLVQWSPIIFAINMSGLLSRRWGNGSNDPRVVSNSDEYLWRYDSNSDWYTCCSTCNAGIAFQVISMYRILWASRINSKPQSFAKCLLLCFYASATYPFGPVFAKHFQVSTQRYIYTFIMYIYIYMNF